jgi:hypothetical protein
MMKAHLQQKIEKLCPTLRPFVKSDGFIYHRLVVRAPDWSATEVNETFAYKKKSIIEAWERKGYSAYVNLYERHYRLKALQKVLTGGEPSSNEEVARLVGDFWIDSENIWQFRSAWSRIWSTLKEPQAAMNPDDAMGYAALPDTLTVYRGVRDKRYDTWRGLSWTVNPAKANEFAQRFANDCDEPVVLWGRIRKKYVFAFFGGRDESEVVLLPRYIRHRKEEPAQQAPDPYARV